MFPYFEAPPNTNELPFSSKMSTCTVGCTVHIPTSLFCLEVVMYRAAKQSLAVLVTTASAVHSSALKTTMTSANSAAPSGQTSITSVGSSSAAAAAAADVVGLSHAAVPGVTSDVGAAKDIVDA